MRPPFIAGNWKMNPPTEAEATALAKAITTGVGPEHDVRVALCPPALFLFQIDGILENSPIGLGGQNLHPGPKTAFTGEISGRMLVEAGCTHVILGHSERRQLGETDAFINQKLHAALEVGLIPILCVGETQEERDAGRTEEVVGGQLEGSLAGIEAELMTGIVLAYEPVWAIGTGRTATPDQAQAVHAFIRQRLGEQFESAISDRVTIQYGGSVKPENAEELLACPDIDGALVGGASLIAEDFLAIIAAARR